MGVFVMAIPRAEAAIKHNFASSRAMAAPQNAMTLSNQNYYKPTGNDRLKSVLLKNQAKIKLIGLIEPILIKKQLFNRYEIVSNYP